MEKRKKRRKEPKVVETKNWSKDDFIDAILLDQQLTWHFNYREMSWIPIMLGEEKLWQKIILH